jgi:antitoxin component YwqK of YwqJK toxin-antitoxin module
MKRILVSGLLFLISVSLFAQTTPRLITEDESYYTLTYYQVGNQKEGAYKETYKQNGKTKVEGNYRNGLKDGVWKYYDLAGNLTKEETYKNDKLNGKLTTYYNNKVSDITDYLNDKKSGVYQRLAPDGSVIEKSTYRNDRLLSRYTYFPDGKVKTEEVIPTNKNRVYYSKQYYNSGAKRIVSTMKNDECIQSITYYENGKIETISQIVDDQLKLVKRYSENGVEMSTDCGC